MNLNRTAFLFPGQGSQAIQMGLELAQTYPEAQAVFHRADEILGYKISTLMWEGPEELLNDTINTQPALMTHSAAALQVLNKKFGWGKPAYVAGHSMGELSALLASEALPFQNALLLSQVRGKLMKAAGDNSPGGMAAILGLEIPVLEEICISASTPGEIVQVANDNCPGQVVISGSNSSLERAVEMAQAAGARRAVRLAVSIAAHSPLMSMAQAEFNTAVDQSGVGDPVVPLVGNVTARPLLTAAEIKTDLQGQLTSRVRWTESIQYMIERGIDTFIEIGSGTVLSGLVKRIDRSVTCYNLGSPSDFDRLESVVNNSQP